MAAKYIQTTEKIEASTNGETGNENIFFLSQISYSFISSIYNHKSLKTVFYFLDYAGCNR